MHAHEHDHPTSTSTSTYPRSLLYTVKLGSATWVFLSGFFVVMGTIWFAPLLFLQIWLTFGMIGACMFCLAHWLDYLLRKDPDHDTSK